MPPESVTRGRGPLDGLSLGGDAAMAVLPPDTRFLFRGRPAAVVAAGRALGAALPEHACQAAIAGDRAALWLGPDEWLLLAPAAESEALREEIERETGEAPHSLVDVSHRQVAIRVFGPAAEMALSVGCPLDLNVEAFPVGTCTRTVLAKSEIVLWRTAPLTFRLEVWRSFAIYTWKVLEEASREFRPKTCP